MKTYQGDHDGTGRRFAIVVSRFNEAITSKLLEGAVDVLRIRGVADDDMTVTWVPGAFEIPLVARRLAQSGRFDAVICLGALIRGQTRHFDYIAEQCSRGIMKIAEETGIVATFGVLTCENREQAVERTGLKVNRGAEAAQAALETVKLLERLADDLGS